MEASALATEERLYYLDWLRVLATLLLIYFHTAMIFVPWRFYVKNKPPSLGLTLLVSFIHQWHMPLFFLISGAASRFSLKRRTGRQYAWERFQRLFIPLLFGTLVIVPPQVFFMLRDQAGFVGFYLKFLPQFFNGLAPEGNFEWAHLWFLAYLFVFSLMCIPVFGFLKGEKGKRFVARLENRLRGRAGILLLALPFVVTEALLRPFWPGFQNLVDD